MLFISTHDGIPPVDLGFMGIGLPCVRVDIREGGRNAPGPMTFVLPRKASIAAPATDEAQASLVALLGPNAGHLLPLYRITDGFECVIRGGKIHLQLWPIAEFTGRREHQVIIGSDSEAGNVVVDTSSEPAIVELWCAFGGGKIETLCPLPGFLAWIMDVPEG